MGFRDLLLFVDPGAKAVGDYGLWLADACGASLTVATPMVEHSLRPHLIAKLPANHRSRMQEDTQAAAHEALRDFKVKARQTSVAVEMLSFKAQKEDVASTLSRIARCFDAAVLPQPDPNGSDTTGIVEAVLFGSGRPLIVVPCFRARADLGTVLIAWDGGAPAARTVADALPVLILARHVHIVTVGGRESEDAYPSGGTLVRHLARHGIRAELKVIAGDVAVAGSLLSHAANIGVDLIVMGGYGHSRFRQIMLGGTTRDMLRLMTVPVLMSH